MQEGGIVNPSRLIDAVSNSQARRTPVKIVTGELPFARIFANRVMAKRAAPQQHPDGLGRNCMFCAQLEARGHTCVETEEHVLFCCPRHTEDRDALFTHIPSGLHSAIAASDIPTQKLKLLLTSTHPPTMGGN